MDCIHIKGAREHNLKNFDLVLPAQPARGHHRPVRQRQVQPGLRHPVRRRPAALRGEPQRLRPAVPGPDGEARRGQHRRPLPGHLHRAEDHQPQPALHRRHRHRDLRLPAPALRPGGQAGVHGLRPAHRQPDHPGDGGPDPGPARGHPGPAAGAGGAGAQGRVPQAPGRPHEARLHPGPGQRRDARPHRRPARPGQAEEAQHRGGHRPAQGLPGHQHPARRQPGDRLQPGRRHRPGGPGRHGAPVLLQAGLQQRRVPALRAGPAGPGAPLVLLQLALRGLHHLRRPGLQAPVRRGADRAQPGPEHQPGLHPGQRLEERGRGRLARPVPGAAGQGAVLQPGHPLEEAVRRGAPGDPARPGPQDEVRLPEQGQPLRVHAQLRRRGGQPGAALPGDQQRGDPGRDGGVHAHHPVRGLRGHAPAPGGAVGVRRRPAHRRRGGPERARGAGLVPGPRAWRARTPSSPRRCSRRSRSAWASWTTWGWAT